LAAVSQLCYLGLSVSDGAAWQKLATVVLGLQVLPGDNDATFYMRMDDNHHRFVVQTGADDDLSYIGWQVSDAPALEEIAARLEGDGIAVTHGTPEEAHQRRVLDFIKVADPGGVPNEICYGPLVSLPYFMPSRPIAGFRTGSLGMGHLVVYQRDLEQSIHFYRDLLGLRVTDHVHMQIPGGYRPMVFLHANARHHSIAFSATPPLPKRIHHFMVEYESIDDVGRANDMCKREEIPIAASFGRHPVDQMFSFFVGTPSGFNIECGWGGQLVDDESWQVRHFTGGGWGHEGLFNNAMRKPG
jgi:2,3-dihydroxybiphenyl 1,2-dioxygenase